MFKKIFSKKLISSVCAAVLAIGLGMPQPMAAETADTLYLDRYPQRIFGMTLYDTAIEISRTGWTSADTAVLATGINYPDALAGTVLARKVDGPLLLTEPKALNPEVLTELKRLNVQKVFILGGTAVVSPEIEAKLQAEGMTVERLAGYDQYGTAAEIAKQVAPSASHVFLVTGEQFPDALSVSSYAAAQGIPLLMTTKNTLPPETIEAMAQLGVTEATLIGGAGVIADQIADQLAALPSPVRLKDRLYGYDRYETNTVVLNNLSYNTDTVFVATGENFPDALAGAALAARQNQPIVLVPRDSLAEYTAQYLGNVRNKGAQFSIFGGWGVINNTMESMIRTGSANPRISLQYVQGGSFTGQLNQIATLGPNGTDYADIVSPSWLFMNDAQGTILGPDGWDGTNNYKQIVNAIHSRGLKALPVIQSSWSTREPIDQMLANPQARAEVQQELLKRVQDSGADGIVIDFEYISPESSANLTLFMQELYGQFHPLNKLVVQAVMSRKDADNWAAFDYAALSQTVDYLHIMTYDYIKSSPGPNAPLSWINQVLTFARDQGTDMKKILLGIAYYGRDWTAAGDGTYSTIQSRGLNNVGGESGIDGALDKLNQSGAALQRDVSKIPYFSYTDVNGKNHTVYYDDAESWTAKMALIGEYGLGGIGAWSLYWVSDESAKVIFPLLKQHLR